MSELEGSHMAASRRWDKLIGAAPLLAAFLLAFPLGAGAASTTPGPPVASTGSTARERGAGAILQGSVNPRGASTTYFFQYGPTVAYGSQTTPGTLAAGFATVKVGQPVALIRAGYHYRLVASNIHGTTFGRDRSYTPISTQLKFEFAKLSEPVPYGGPLVLSGVLTGADSGNHRIQLQESPFPYLTPFVPLAPIQTTGVTGRFEFRVPSIVSNTQFRVATIDPLPILSPVVTAHVAVRVTLKVKGSGRRGIVRLYGTVRPAEVGARVFFQLERQVRPSSGSESSEEHTVRFAAIATGVVKRATRSASRFSAVVNIKQTGHYRAFVRLHRGPLVSGFSPTIFIHGAPPPQRTKH
jgi:hypothetical protein